MIRAEIAYFQKLAGFLETCAQTPPSLLPSLALAWAVVLSDFVSGQAKVPVHVGQQKCARKADPTVFHLKGRCPEKSSRSLNLLSFAHVDVLATGGHALREFLCPRAFHVGMNDPVSQPFCVCCWWEQPVLDPLAPSQDVAQQRLIGCLANRLRAKFSLVKFCASQEALMEVPWIR